MSDTIDHDNAERLAGLLSILAAESDDDADAVPIDTLDGYMTALICGPVVASPIQAMDALFGDSWPAVLEEREAIEEFMEALHLRWNEIAEALDPESLLENQDAMRLEPLITEFDEATKAELLSSGVLREDQLADLPDVGVMWAEGFMQAVDDFEDAWYVNEDDSEPGQMLDTLLLAVAVLAMPEGTQRQRYIEDSYEPEDEVTQDVLLDDALFSVQDLRLFWLQAGAGGDTRH